MALTPDQRFRFVNDYAEDHGFFAGFPNFHVADDGNGLVGGVNLLRDTVAEWRDVPRTTYGVYHIEDVPALFRAAADYAFAEGYAAAFPNCHQQDHGDGVVYGTILIKPDVVEWRDVPHADLGKPKDDDVRAMMTAAHDYAIANGFASAFPTFHRGTVGGQRVYGIVLFKPGTTEWRDVPDESLYFVEPRDVKTAVVLLQLRDDNGDLTPQPEDPDFYRRYFFEDGKGERGLFDFWREVTHGRIRIVGDVAGWLDSGHTVEEHNAKQFGEQRRQAYYWGIAAARASGMPIDTYPGKVVIVNAGTDFGGVDGGMLVGHGNGGVLDHGYWEHEFGHLLGLDDAFGPGGRYEDYYCVMSYARTPFRSIQSIFSVKSACGPAVNGVYCERLGGIPPRRIVDLNGSELAVTVRMAALGHADRDGWLLARVLPTGGTANTYWLEYRHPSGWDIGIVSGTAVVHFTKPNDGSSYLAPGPHARALREPGDEVMPEDSSLVFRLVTVSTDQLDAEVRIWELGEHNLRIVRIRLLVVAGPGNDLDVERAVIRNDQEKPINLDGWTLSDSSAHPASSPSTFRFPSFTLEPGEDVSVWTRDGDRDAHNLYWKRGSPVWNNVGGDAAILRNPDGVEISRLAYQ